VSPFAEGPLSGANLTHTSLGLTNWRFARDHGEDGGIMFTVISLLASRYIAWYADECNVEDRNKVSIVSDDEIRDAILNARQDIKLVCFLLFAILMMLGVISDLIIVELITSGKIHLPWL
jgi:hypothetical protein